MANTETSGVVYPSVTIDRRVLRVCCSYYAEYQLSRMGLTLQDCLDILNSKRLTGKIDPRWFANVIDMWTACVSENYADETPPTAEQWARKISRIDDIKVVKEICVALGEALGKRFPVADPPAAQPESQPAQQPN